MASHAADSALHLVPSTSRVALPRYGTARTIAEPISRLSRRAIPPVSGRNVLRINAFGSLSVISDAGELTGAATQPRRLAILALLARAGDRGLQRDKIVDVLWTDVESDQARKTFAKALHALRRDLGVDDAIVGGTADLRLNPAVISSDVREFEIAIAEGDLQQAVTLYTGPFLDAFRLHGTTEFERWVEVERDQLRREYETAREKLAAAESSRGEYAAAVRWLRKLAAQDPLNGRHALRLMQALSSAGDRVGAMQHARVYEALVEQELDLPPDREVVAFARRLRQESATTPAVTKAPVASAVNAVTSVVPSGAATSVAGAAAVSAAPASLDAPNAIPLFVEPASSEDGVAAGAGPIAEQVARAGYAASAQRPARHVALWVVAVAVVAVAGATVWGTRLARARASTRDDAVIAVGRITDYRQPGSSELARPLGDMLATNLARVPELRVLSTARMYELLLDSRRAGDTTSAATVTAARRAGARRLVDGALFRLADDRLRLDLRLMDLADGNVIVAHSVTGADPFSLVDSATALLVTQAGVAAPAGSIADVSTRSVVAYRLYEEGLREFSSGHFPAADRLMRAASKEDSTFAMAAFYGARSAMRLSNWPAVWERFAVARRYAARATERERMLIELEFRMQSYSPAVRALADSFVARFPHDVDGYRYVGIVALSQGRFEDAVRNLRRVIAMDSLGGEQARCAGCEAMATLLVAYTAMDSLEAMLREARRWVQLQPRSPDSWRELAGALALSNRSEEALAALRTSAAFSSMPDEPVTAAHIRIRAGNFADADRDLIDVARSTEPERRSEMLWMLAISLRYQGRLDEALARAIEFRRASPSVDAVPGVVATSAIPQAQVLFERGDYAQAAALYDSMATVTAPPELESFAAKTRVWFLTHAATARAYMGDTASLQWMTDSIRVIGARSYIARDQRLYHYPRGLLLAARGQLEAAAEELRQAIWSPTLGFTRVNYELARIYLRLGRPRDAVTILQPALRGPLDASNYYLARSDLHEQLGLAWLAAGRLLRCHPWSVGGFDPVPGARR